MLKFFYKITSSIGEEGIGLVVNKFVSIHETNHFHFCVRERNFLQLVDTVLQGKSKIQYARESKYIKVYRMAKNGCRIAFETEQAAFENFVWLQGLRLRHLSRDIIFTKKIIETCKGNKFDQFNFDVYGYRRLIPDTQELVLEYYRFD